MGRIRWPEAVPGQPGDMDDTRKHDAAPHDSEAHEPLGPLTPDDESPLGDTPEVHDDISPHDLPRDHPGRAALVRETDRRRREAVGGNT